MWAHIELVESTECIRAMLKRSGQVPLTISENTTYFRDQVLRSKVYVLKEIQRIRELQISVDTCTCTVLSKLAAKFTVTDAPLLRALDICYNDRRLHAPFDSIPEISSWTLSSLVWLAFHECAGRIMHNMDGRPHLGLIRPFLRSTLTHLEIDSLEDPISVDVCLDLLRTLPRLETLALGDVLSSVSMEDIPYRTQPLTASHIVSLQYLREITLKRTSIWLHEGDVDMEIEDTLDSGVAAADLLRCLDIPASTNIHFAAGFQYLSVDALNFIFSVLCNKVTGTSEDLSTPFVNCTVCLRTDADSGDYVLQVQLNSDLIHVITTPGDTGPPPPIDLGRTLDVTVRRPCLENFHAVLDFDAVLIFFAFGFPLTNVLTMHWLGSDDAVERRYWTTVLRALPALQELSVRRSVRGFIHGMDRALNLSWASVHGVGTTMGPTKSVLPYLKTLKFEDMNCHWCCHRNLGDPSYSVSSDWDHFASLLIQTFTKWSTASTDGNPKVLKDLILETPGPPSQADLTLIKSSAISASVICPQTSLWRWCDSCHLPWFRRYSLVSIG